MITNVIEKAIQGLSIWHSNLLPKFLDYIEKSKRITKYYKREGTKGKYVYYYTKKEYDEAKSKKNAKKGIKKTKPEAKKEVTKKVKGILNESKNKKDAIKKIKELKPKQKYKTISEAKKDEDNVIETKKRFSNTKEIDRNKIITDPGTFQGRTEKYSQESVDKIVSEGYDKSNDPIVVWKDTKKNKYIVISGHSRFEASERLYKKGDKSLQKMPVKEFLGTKQEAVKYATLESNRASKNEGFLSDVNAVRKMLKEGYNKNEMLKYITPKSYLDKVVNYTYLNPKGLFIEQLNSPAKISFPYLERNADWVGTLKKMNTKEGETESKITNEHEKEIFDFLYLSANKNLKLNKNAFFNLINRKVNSPNFKKTEPLNLKNYVSNPVETKEGKELLDKYESEVMDFHKISQKKQDLITEATLIGDEKLANKFETEFMNLHKKIIDTKLKMAKLKRSMESVESNPARDLFSKSLNELESMYIVLNKLKTVYNFKN